MSLLRHEGCYPSAICLDGRINELHGKVLPESLKAGHRSDFRGSQVADGLQTGNARAHG